MTNYDKEQAMSVMVSDLLWLICQERNIYRWTGTKRELIELTHKVWLRNVVFDSTGHPLPFIRLLRRVCAIVGMAVPKKPTAMLDTISHRKNQEYLSIVSCYVQILHSTRHSLMHMSFMPEHRPIMRFMEEVEQQKVA